MTEDLESLAAHQRAIDATIPLLGAIQSIAEMAYRDADRAGAPVRAYAARVHGLLDVLVTSLEPADRQQLLARMAGPGPGAVVAIGSERGLCGAFNDRLVRHLAGLLQPETPVACWGSRVARLLRTAGYEVALCAPLPSLVVPPYADVERMTLDLLDLVDQRRLGRLVAVFNAPLRGFQYTATVRSILPPAIETPAGRRVDLDIKPAADIPNLFVHLVTEYVLTELYSAVIQSAVSEQLARVAAMRLAGDNARKLLDDLTVQYNLARQHAVTQSLLEIVIGYQTAVGKVEH
jgi:F-type H+-transporting ATPase subunit gamma